MKKQVGLYFVGVYILLLVYTIASTFIDNSLILPSIDEVFFHTINLLGVSSTYVAIAASVGRTLIGFFVALILAVILALFMERFTFLRTMFIPINSMLKSVPVASVIIIFLLIVGIGKAPLYVAFLLSFPILYEGITAGLTNIHPELIDTLEMDGKANYLYQLFKIKFPLSIPYFSVAVMSSLGMSFKAEIMAEVLTGSTSLQGIGIHLYQAKYYVEVVDLFSWTLIAIGLVLIIDVLLKYLITKIHRWLFE